MSEESLIIEPGSFSLPQLHQEMVGRRVSTSEDFYRELHDPRFKDTIDILKGIVPISEEETIIEGRRREEALWQNQSGEPLRWSVELIANAIDTQRRKNPDITPNVFLSVTQMNKGGLNKGGWQILISDRVAPGGEGMDSDTYFNTFLKPYASGSAESASSIGTMGVGSQQVYGLCQNEGDKVFISTEQNNQMLIARAEPDQNSDVVKLSVAGKIKDSTAAIPHNDGTRIIIQLSNSTASAMQFSPDHLAAYLKDRFGGMDWAGITYTSLSQKNIGQDFPRSAQLHTQRHRLSKVKEEFESKVKTSYDVLADTKTLKEIHSNNGAMTLRYSRELTTSEDPTALVYFDVLGVGFGEAHIIQGIGLPREVRLSIDSKIENITEARTDIRLSPANVQDLISMIGTISNNESFPVEERFKLIRCLEDVFSKFQDMKLYPVEMRNRKEFNIWQNYRTAISNLQDQAKYRGITVVPEELSSIIDLPPSFLSIPLRLANEDISHTLPEQLNLREVSDVRTARGDRVYFANGIKKDSVIETVNDMLIINTQKIPECASQEESVRKFGLLKACALVSNRVRLDKKWQGLTLEWHKDQSSLLSDIIPKPDPVFDRYDDEEGDTSEYEDREYIPYTYIIEEAESYLEQIQTEWESFDLLQKRKALSNLIGKMKYEGEDVFKGPNGYNVWGHWDHEGFQYWKADEDTIDSLFNIVELIFQRDHIARNSSYSLYSPTKVDLSFLTVLSKNLDSRQMEACIDILETDIDIHTQNGDDDDFYSQISNGSFEEVNIRSMLEHRYPPEYMSLWRGDPAIRPISQIFTEDRWQQIFDHLEKPAEWQVKAMRFLGFPFEKEPLRGVTSAKGHYFLSYFDMFTEEDLDFFTDILIPNNDDTNTSYRESFLWSSLKEGYSPKKIREAFSMAQRLGVSYSEINKDVFSNSTYQRNNAREIEILRFFLASDVDLQQKEINDESISFSEVSPEKLLVLAHGKEGVPTSGVVDALEGLTFDSAELTRSRRELLHPINRLSSKPGSGYIEILKNAVQALAREGAHSSIAPALIIQDFQTILADQKLAYGVSVLDGAGMEPEDALVKLSVPALGEGMHGLGFLKLLADMDEIRVKTSRGKAAGYIQYIPIKNDQGTVIEVKMKFAKVDEPRESFKGTQITMLKFADQPAMEGVVFRSTIEEDGEIVPSNICGIYLNPQSLQHANAEEIMRELANNTFITPETALNSDHIQFDQFDISNIGTVECKSISGTEPILRLSINNSTIEGFSVRETIMHADIPRYAKDILIDSGIVFNISGDTISTVRDGSTVSNNAMVTTCLREIVESHWESLMSKLASIGRLNPTRFLTTHLSPRFFDSPEEILRSFNQGSYEKSLHAPRDDNEMAAYRLAFQPMYHIAGFSEALSMIQIAEGYKTRKIASELIPQAIRSSIELLSVIPETKNNHVPITEIEYLKEKLFKNINVNEFAHFSENHANKLGEMLLKSAKAVGLENCMFVIQQESSTNVVGSGTRQIPVFRTIGGENYIAYYKPHSDSLHFSTSMFIPFLNASGSLIMEGTGWEVAVHEEVHVKQKTEETTFVHPPAFYEEVERAILRLSMN